MAFLLPETIMVDPLINRSVYDPQSDSLKYELYDAKFRCFPYAISSGVTRRGAMGHLHPQA